MHNERIRFAFLITAFLSQSGPLRAIEASPVSLRQCYEWAKERSEDLKIKRENITQAQARARAALGGAFPRLEWEYKNTWQDPAGVERLGKKGFSGFVERNQVESDFSLKQPLFSGLKEFSARAGFKKESERDALRLRRFERELLEKTAVAFYTVLSHETDQKNTQAAVDLAQNRVKDLRAFLRLGKSRDSEVFTAQAHASALKAQLEQIRARITSSREELSYLTGKNLSLETLLDEIPGTPRYGTLGDALARARERADLKAQREDMAARRLRVRYEKGKYWPTADVTGKYYTRRAAFMDDIDWDVVLSLNVPLFQGGSVSAGVREAESAYRQSALTLEEMERQVLYRVRRLYGDLTGAIGETQALEEAAEAALKSYNALQKEYRLGLVTNLEVLQALDLLQKQESARDAARYKSKMLYVQLLSAVSDSEEPKP